MTATFLPGRAPHTTALLATTQTSRRSASHVARSPQRVLTLDNVERVPRLSPEALHRDHLSAGRPVIVTGLWEGHPAERLTDPDRARRTLGRLPLPVGPNLIDEFLHGRDRPKSRWLPLADFYDELKVGSRQMCLEHDVPDELGGLLPETPYLAAEDPDDFWISQMFMAGPGAFLHLHYDMDLRNVVMYQVFGRKRFVMVSASQTRKLAAGAAPNVPYTSGMYLQNFTPEDQIDFLRYVDAWDCVLQPGEALVIPATTWHYVEYLDVALSLNVRLPRNPYMLWLAESVPNTSVELQALATLFRDEHAVDARAQEAFARLVATATRRYPHEDARAAALDRLVADLAARLGLPIAQPPYQVADIARRALLEQDRGPAEAPAVPRRRSTALRTGVAGRRRARTV